MEKMDEMKDMKEKMHDGKASMMKDMDGHQEGKYDMEKIKKTFSKDLCDEINDSNKYMDMAMCAERMGNEKLAKGLMEMSHDEYTHAKFIHYNLVNWGCDIETEDLVRWQELKDRIKQKFRTN